MPSKKVPKIVNDVKVCHRLFPEYKPCLQGQCALWLGTKCGDLAMIDVANMLDGFNELIARLYAMETSRPKNKRVVLKD